MRVPLPAPLAAVVFDVDGVLVESPHERAWRDALKDITDPARFTTEIYQTHVAGKPRLSGARAALEQLGLPYAGQHTLLYAERKVEEYPIEPASHLRPITQM